jgi:hypothetical protein
MVRFPVGGNILAFFSYVLGLCRLGHQVVYLEESGWPRSCYDPASGQWHDDPSAGLKLVRSLMSEYDLHVPVLYLDRDSDRADREEWGEARRVLAEADLLLNVGGVCWLPEFTLCERLALVDMDPLFTQAGEFGVRLGMDFQSYHALFSYGANIGLSGCTVPLMGADWLPTVPPVVPEMWNAALPADGAPLTTVASWSAYGAITYAGEHYGQKDEEFTRLLDLPGRTPQKLELALSGVPGEVVERFRSAGWLVRDANEGVNKSIQAYMSYIRASRGEFSVAKHAYVKSRSGWFSDRSVCYLASGLPVVLQNTGFSDWLPTGEGVLAFSSVQEAAACIEQVNRDYRAHCNAARKIAEETFSYKVVLPSLLDRALSGGKSPHPAVAPGDMA